MRGKEEKTRRLKSKTEAVGQAGLGISLALKLSQLFQPSCHSLSIYSKLAGYQQRSFTTSSVQSKASRSLLYPSSISVLCLIFLFKITQKKRANVNLTRTNAAGISLNFFFFEWIHYEFIFNSLSLIKKKFFNFLFKFLGFRTT